MIHFLIEFLVCQTWFGQFDGLYFILSWLVMRCKLQPELAADNMIETVGSSQYTFNHPLLSHSGFPRQGCASHKSTNKQIPSEASEEPSDTIIHLYFYVSSSSTGELCSQPIRGNVLRIGRMFPEHV